jgi:hypothetical protein
VRRLDVVTPTLNGGEALEATARSLIQLSLHSDDLWIRWIVVSGDSSATVEESAESAIVDSGVQLELIWRRPMGIFDAMNVGLSRVSGDAFMILGSGDTLRSGAATAAKIVDPDAVLAGLTTWHEIRGGQPVYIQRRQLRGAPLLGRFRMHQGMVFGAALASWRYSTQFSVASDLDMKLQLFRAGRLSNIDLLTASCLGGGVSDISPRPSQVMQRSHELQLVFSRHYTNPWLTLVWMAHTLRLGQRSLFGSSVGRRNRIQTIETP